MQNEKSERPLAVITGASSGIGFELAKIFAKNNFDLLIAADHDDIIGAANSLKSFGGQVEALRTDLATFQGVENLYQKIKSIGKPVDSVAINAGVGVSGAFAETNLGEEINLIQLNIVSAVHLTKRLLPEMLSRGQGRILFTSSIAAEMPGPYLSIYAASKAFLQSFSEALREEVKDKGVVVMALQPGPTDTNFFERADMMDTKAGQGKKDDPAQVAEQGFNALMKDKDHVVAGSLMNQIQAFMARFISEPRAAKTHAQQTKPGSAYHH